LRSAFLNERLIVIHKRCACSVIFLAGILVSGCRQQQPHDFLAPGKWLDLTYDYSSDTIYWPTGKPFELEVESLGRTPSGYFYSAERFSASEHGGTHLDAPHHFAEGKWTADQIPIDRLAGPAIVVDVTKQSAASANYQVTPDVLESWERDNGRIPNGAIVLIRTGWGKNWPDKGKYLGTSKTGPDAVAELHFPGIGPDTARWLLKHGGIDAVGIDTASIDYGQSKLFETHQILMGADIPAFENVARLGDVPVTGAYVIALPMKIRGGSGGPLRIVAILP